MPSLTHIYNRKIYEPISENDMLLCHESKGLVYFCTPDRHKNTNLQISYGGPSSNVSYDEGAPYKRIHDRTNNTYTYLRFIP